MNEYGYAMIQKGGEMGKAKGNGEVLEQRGLGTWGYNGNGWQEEETGKGRRINMWSTQVLGEGQ